MKCLQNRLNRIPNTVLSVQTVEREHRVNKLPRKVPDQGPAKVVGIGQGGTRTAVPARRENGAGHSHGSFLGRDSFVRRGQTRWSCCLGIGELPLTSDSVSEEQRNKPEETAKAHVEIDGEVSCCMNDFARLDKSGELSYANRRADVIKHKG